MTDFYTSVLTRGNSILFRGIKNGKRVKEKRSFEPSLFVLSPQGQFKTLKGLSVKQIDFSDIKAARGFIQNNEGVSNQPIFGMRRFEYAYINQQHPETDIDWNINQVLVARIDIEVKSDNGFPEPSSADMEVTAITIKLNDVIHVFGCGDFVAPPHVIYHKCLTELDLLRSFVQLWSSDYPDIVTGWYIDGFDIPYLVNRIHKVLGESWRDKLSPWGVIKETVKFFKGKEKRIFTILGVAVWDSIELYKRYNPQGEKQESYKLDAIGEVEELGKKIDYSSYGDLNALYRDNYQLFIEYNIRDVELDEKIALKYDVINLGLTLAYMNKVNFEDVFQQVRMWAAIVDRELLNRGIVINHGIDPVKTQYSGGFVKDPIPGLYNYVINWDLDGLYPHLIMQYSISPDSFIEPEDYTDEMREFLRQKIDVDTLLEQKVDTSVLKKLGCCVTPNKQLFRTDKRGFLPEIMDKIYRDRKKYKQIQLDGERDAEKTTGEEKARLEKIATKAKSIQTALKVCLNSAYGAMGSEYFVLYDARLAEAITSAGRLSVQWVGVGINSYLQKATQKPEHNFIIAQDTDSMYLSFKPLVEAVMPNEKDVNKIIDFLDKVDDIVDKEIDKIFVKLKDYTNAYEQKMFMKRENIADVGVWKAKKRYFLNVYVNEKTRYKKPKIKITGLEPIRSVVPATARSAMKKCFKFIASGEQKKLQAFAKRIKRNWHKAPLDRISFAVGVNGLDTYSDVSNIFKSGTPQHVRASLMYNRRLKEFGLDKKYEPIKDGNKIRYVYLKEPNKLGTDVIAYQTVIPKEFDINGSIDYNACYEKSFAKPISEILETFGWQLVKRATLEDFFV